MNILALTDLRGQIQWHFVFCGEALDGQGKATIGSTLVVNPGPLAEGYYAILDTREKKVYFGDVR